uniref:Cadherin domain-containing protein n=1 Tax=Macrostomum lignano TaxID=282301 RepID=A0A1I8F588_9PLAT
NVVDFRHWGIPLSRRFRSLKVWFVIRSYGVEGLRRYIRNHCMLAKLFESQVKRDNRFELVGQVHFGLVCFRWKDSNALTQYLIRQINDSGKLHMIPATVKGQYIIRFALCSEHAKEEDVFYAWNVIKTHADEISTTIKTLNMWTKQAFRNSITKEVDIEQEEDVGDAGEGGDGGEESGTKQDSSAAAAATADDSGDTNEESVRRSLESLSTGVKVEDSDLGVGVSQEQKRLRRNSLLRMISDPYTYPGSRPGAGPAAVGRGKAKNLISSESTANSDLSVFDENVESEEAEAAETPHENNFPADKMPPMASAAPRLLLAVLSLLAGTAASISDLVIEEDQPAGTALPQLNQPLRDAGILSGSFVLFRHPYFEYDPVSKGPIRVKKLLDRDTMCQTDKLCCENLRDCQLTLTFLNSHAGTISTKTLRVTLRDANDHSPRFDQTLLRISISEETSAGFSERLPLAHDPDAEDNSVVQYDLKPNTGRFNLRPEHGMRRSISKLFLELTSSLDREEAAEYDLTLTAIDGSGRNGSMRILVSVNDSNDHYPYFMHSHDTVHVNESQRFGCVAGVSARDDDIGINAKIVYELDARQLGEEAETIQQKFRLERSTGRICLNGQLDYEERSKYELPIVAKNVVPYTRQQSLATATVTVLVVNENDEKPTLRIHYMQSGERRIFASVRENERAAGGDGQGRGLNELRAGQPTDRGQFRLHDLKEAPKAKDQYIYLLGTLTEVSLDREAFLQGVPPERANSVDVKHEVRIICRDGRNSVSGNITVQVLDENDNDPQLSVRPWSGRLSAHDSHVVEVDENVPENFRVARVVGIDLDYQENGTVGYSMRGSPMKTLESFTVLADGVIVTKKRLDREETNPPTDAFDVVVVGTDKGNPARSSTISFRLAINDQNDNPPHMESKMEFSVTENNKPGLQVGQIYVSDPDRCNRLLGGRWTGDFRFTFGEELQSTSPEQRRFFLVATESLDSERINKYEFLIIATDDDQGRGHRVTSLVTVNVIDQNDHSPKIFYPCTDDTPTAGPAQSLGQRRQLHRHHNVSWREATGYTIVKVNAKDDDRQKTTNGRFLFSLEPGQLFSIDQESGEVKVAARMKQRDMGKHRVRVTVRDSGLPTSLSASCEFFITVDASQPHSRSGGSSGDRLSGAGGSGGTHFRGGVGNNGNSGFSFFQMHDASILVAVAAFIFLLLIATVLLLCYARHWHNTPEFLPDLLLL